MDNSTYLIKPMHADKVNLEYLRFVFDGFDERLLWEIDEILFVPVEVRMQ